MNEQMASFITGERTCPLLHPNPYQLLFRVTVRTDDALDEGISFAAERYQANDSGHDAKGGSKLGHFCSMRLPNTIRIYMYMRRAATEKLETS